MDVVCFIPSLAVAAVIGYIAFQAGISHGRHIRMAETRERKCSKCDGNVKLSATEWLKIISKCDKCGETYLD